MLFNFLMKKNYGVPENFVKEDNETLCPGMKLQNKIIPNIYFTYDINTIKEMKKTSQRIKNNINFNDLINKKKMLWLTQSNDKTI